MIDVQRLLFHGIVIVRIMKRMRGPAEGTAGWRVRSNFQKETKPNMFDPGKLDRNQDAGAMSLGITPSIIETPSAILSQQEKG
jgi:hypothetical protein